MRNVECNAKDMAVRDYCLVWGCPGLVILTISLFASLKVGNYFGQDNFAKFVIYIISSGLLGAVYFLFQSVLADVPLKVQNRQHKETKLLTYQEAETVTENSIGSTCVEQVQECSEDNSLSTIEEVTSQTEFTRILIRGAERAGCRGF